MRGDYKYEMQRRAEELAEQETGRDFYDLPEAERDRFFQRGMESYRDDMVQAADLARDREDTQ